MNHPLNPNTPRSLTSGALESAERAAGPAVKAVSHGVGELRANAGPALRELASGAEDMALGRLRAAREQALHLRDSGVGYVRGHPMQSLLLAAAAGVGLALVLGLLSGRNRRD